MTADIRIVSSWEKACGVADYARQLVAAVSAADPELHIGTASPTYFPHLLHLNYHESVTAGWTPAELGALRARGVRTVVTYHNTFGEHTPQELRNSGDHRLDLLEAFCHAADAVVVHEPCKGLPENVQHYFRQGVPAAAPAMALLAGTRAYPAQPLLGSLGFPFPWKGYDKLAAMTKEAGWALMLIAPTATPADIVRWQGLNPHLYVYSEFLPTAVAVSLLSACDATAFLYEGAFAGTSGAVRFGIAARKPVMLFAHQRQMRDLIKAYTEEFHLIMSWEHAREHLISMPIQRIDSAMVYVAEQDSWTRLGQKYAALYRKLLAWGI